jgi:hypothetical protein
VSLPVQENLRTDVKEIKNGFTIFKEGSLFLCYHKNMFLSFLLQCAGRVNYRTFT